MYFPGIFPMKMRELKNNRILKILSVPFIYQDRGWQVSADATGVDEVSLVTNEPEAFFDVQTALHDGSARIQSPPDFSEDWWSKHPILFNRIGSGKSRILRTYKRILRGCFSKYPKVKDGYTVLPRKWTTRPLQKWWLHPKFYLFIGSHPEGV